MSDRVFDPDELELQLYALGRARYHDRHPFHRLLLAGKLSRSQVHAWALNRFCYQAAIPSKDAMILARSPDVALRRVWRQRLVDQDGSDDHPGASRSGCVSPTKRETRTLEQQRAVPPPLSVRSPLSVRPPLSVRSPLPVRSPMPVRSKATSSEVPS